VTAAGAGRWRPWGRRPSTTVVTDSAVDDEALRDARDAVLATGDWRPAADLLAATAPDPDLRGRRVDVLAEAVVPDPRWADDWLDRDLCEYPEVRSDVDAALRWVGSEPGVSLRDLTVLRYALYRANRMAEAHVAFARAGCRAFRAPLVPVPVRSGEGLPPGGLGVGSWTPVPGGPVRRPAGPTPGGAVDLLAQDVAGARVRAGHHGRIRSVRSPDPVVAPHRVEGCR
jgi:hypothetical protein